MGEKKRFVSFNLEKELQLYEFSKKLNFSAFVKRYLAHEFNRRLSQQSQSEITVHMGE